MSEIQYCEDCKHVKVADGLVLGKSRIEYARCGALSAEHRGLTYVARIFIDDEWFCSVQRQECGETCPKFEAKDG